MEHQPTIEALHHPEVDLPGVTRLSHQRFDDGHRLRFDGGERVDKAVVVSESTLKSGGLTEAIREKLDEAGANAYSVEPCIDREPDSVKVTLFKLEE